MNREGRRERLRKESCRRRSFMPIAAGRYIRFVSYLIMIHDVPNQTKNNSNLLECFEVAALVDNLLKLICVKIISARSSSSSRRPLPPRPAYTACIVDAGRALGILSVCQNL